MLRCLVFILFSVVCQISYAQVKVKAPLKNVAILNINYRYLYSIKITQIMRWKIRCTDPVNRVQSIENKRGK